MKSLKQCLFLLILLTPCLQGCYIGMGSHAYRYAYASTNVEMERDSISQDGKRYIIREKRTEKGILLKKECKGDNFPFQKVDGYAYLQNGHRYHVIDQFDKEIGLRANRVYSLKNGMREWRLVQQTLYGVDGKSIISYSWNYGGRLTGITDCDMNLKNCTYYYFNKRGKLTTQSLIPIVQML